MKRNYCSILTLCVLFIGTLPQTINSYNNHPPKLTIVLIVDQLAYHYINKLYPHLRQGLRYLLDNGVNYTNAHTPHPNTGPSHATFNTGAYAKDHGIVGNKWFGKNGEKINCDDDNSPQSLVLSPTENGTTYDYGKSSHFLMVDGLSDQCVMQSEPNSTFRSFSISGKSRSAIATAGKLGKGIWFDQQSGLFTSSKAYFDELPTWLQQFNRTHNTNQQDSIIWQRMYPKSPSAYNFFNTNNYDYARTHETMLNRQLPTVDPADSKNPYHFFERTPHANKLLLDLAQECISKNVNRKSKDRLLLWVCLSPLDKLAHEYGPNSIEAIDMIYHLDKQLRKFIRFALKAVGKHQVAFALTADHGIMPIPELLKQDGLTTAVRIDQQPLVQQLNNQIKNNYNVADVVLGYKGQELVLNESNFNQLNNNKKQEVITNLKNAITSHPHIKQAWSLEELINKTTEPNSIEDSIKKQLFPGRTGQIVVQPYPYTLITHLPEGASHKSPYEYDTHIPLVLFYTKFGTKHVRQRVSSVQLANTLAEILNVPKPSASTAEVLPELFDPEYQ